MSTYIYTLIVAAVVVAIVCALTPEDGETGKFVAFAGALCIAITVLSPLVGKDFRNLFEIEEISSAGESDPQVICSYYARQATNSLSLIYGIDTDKIKAIVTYDMEVRQVKLEVEAQMLSAEEAGEHISEILGVRVVVCEV